MFIDAIGKSLAAHGGIGIARPVFAEMLRAQEARTQNGAAGNPRTVASEKQE